MTARRDPVRVLSRTAIYVFFCIVGLILFGWMLIGSGLFVASVGSVMLAALIANGLALRIFDNLPLADLGLRWNRHNLFIGMIGGAGSACVVLTVPLALGMAHFRALPSAEVHLRSVLFMFVLLAAGSAAEELLIHGYAFQTLFRAWGPLSAILPVAVVFALLHRDNPNASYLGLVNTFGFGALFGYAFYRSRDLWLPIGLHFGWNFTLPVFGADISGLKIGVTGYAIEWSAGTFWSGGDYGPEASILTSAVMFLLLAYLWRAPILRQPNRFTDPPAEETPCVTG